MGEAQLPDVFPSDLQDLLGGGWGEGAQLLGTCVCMPPPPPLRPPLLGHAPWVQSTCSWSHAGDPPTHLPPPRVPGGRGFNFDASRPGCRDVFLEGDCDQGVRQLCRCAGSCGARGGGGPGGGGGGGEATWRGNGDLVGCRWGPPAQPLPPRVPEGGCRLLGWEEELDQLVADGHAEFDRRRPGSSSGSGSDGGGSSQAGSSVARGAGAEGGSTSGSSPAAGAAAVQPVAAAPAATTNTAAAAANTSAGSAVGGEDGGRVAESGGRGGGSGSAGEAAARLEEDQGAPPASAL